MSWISRYAARTGSRLAFVALLAAAFAPGARASAQSSAYVFEGKTYAFTHLVKVGGATAIGADDPALASLLRDLGATISWQPGERYVLITTAQPLVVSFAVGERSYSIGPVQLQAPFITFMRNGIAYVPFDALMAGLDLASVQDGSQTILQPQLAAIDVQSSPSGAKVVAHAGIPLDARVLAADSSHVSILFDGVGSTLAPFRRVDSGGVATISVRTQGTARHPQTIVTFRLQPGATHGSPGTDDQRDFTIGFNGQSATPPPIAAAQGAPPALQSGSQAAASSTSSGAGSAAPGQAQITSVVAESGAEGTAVTVNVDGDAQYDWHRLRPPDDRFWVDIEGARLQNAPSGQSEESGPVSSVRVHQDNPNTVRIALSLRGYQTIEVQPSATGLTIVVENTLADATAPHGGSGSVGSNAGVDATVANEAQGPWKFSPRAVSSYVASDPRLIVIDPGHGGSDPGVIREGVMEKTLTLDMAKRLRAILVARGWQVKMTRTTDRDVFEPDDSARDELQARDDVANAAGARLFVSIHVNGFINAGPHGTTTYYSKPIDVPLARAVEGAMAQSLGTSDDGIVKSKLYVTLHADMPAILVETAFLSNPDDYAKLISPQWRQRAAEAIADGIGRYAGTPPPPATSSGQ